MAPVRILPLALAFALLTPSWAEDSPQGSTTLFFLTADRTEPVAVRRAETRFAGEALQELIAGPTEEERSRGITTAFPADVKLRSLRMEGGNAFIDFSGLPDTTSPVERFRIITQLTKSLTGVSGIERIWLRDDGRPWGLWLMRGGIKDGPYTVGECTEVGTAKPGTETVIADSFSTCRD
jgi:hypothetical protein